MLVGCAENLMGSARSVVKDCEAASIKIRTGQGQVMKWKRERDHYQVILSFVVVKKHMAYFNPLMPGGNKKVIHTASNLQFPAAGLFKYV